MQQLTQERLQRMKRLLVEPWQLPRKGHCSLPAQPLPGQLLTQPVLRRPVSVLKRWGQQPQVQPVAQMAEAAPLAQSFALSGSAQLPQTNLARTIVPDSTAVQRVARVREAGLAGAMTRRSEQLAPAVAR